MRMRTAGVPLTDTPNVLGPPTRSICSRRSSTSEKSWNTTRCGRMSASKTVSSCAAKNTSVPSRNGMTEPAFVTAGCAPPESFWAAAWDSGISSRHAANADRSHRRV
jgi:hypothetical protein